MTILTGDAMRRRLSPAILAAAVALSGFATPSLSQADDLVLGGMTWMTGYPATWNAAAPKIVSDGLHMFSVLCGFHGSPNLCSVARKRGGERWIHNAATFRSQQPAVAIIDRKGRLNVFFNDPALRHIRFDHPSVDLLNGIEMPIGATPPVGYLHASYDAATDTILLAGNDTTTWTAYFSAKVGDAGWTPPAALPGPDPAGSMYLYARTLYAGGRYYVLTGEHPRAGSNASYRAAVLFESPQPTGPWTARVIHRATGANVGVPYQNWVIPTDLQADIAGRVRVLVHIVESGSGHPPLAEGLHISRQEDSYALRHVASGIDDGFALQIDPSGIHLAIALRLSDPRYPEAGHLVVFRSDDGGVSWQPAQRIVDESSLNPVMVDRRSGSMSAPKTVPFIYSAPLSVPFERVMSGAISLNLPDTPDRQEYDYATSDGWPARVRVFRDSTSGRLYRYQYVYGPDNTFSIQYEYVAGSYSQTYLASSTGAYRYYNSDGYDVSYTPR